MTDRRLLFSATSARPVRSALFAFLLLLLLLPLAACAPKVSLFGGAGEPLHEVTLEGREGSGEGKVLLIDVRGMISDAPQKGLFSSRPSVVQDVVSRLRLAEDDDAVKAVLLKVDSPGGTSTASDMLYHELTEFKRRTGKKLVVAMMSLATSGGYYVSLPADWILAHPTTLTGSVGVVFLRPKVDGLMDTLGIRVRVSKSGRNKDMGSPFRPETVEETALLDQWVAGLGKDFVDLVDARRHLTPEARETVATARVLPAREALRLGLVDEVGYLDQAVDKARALAGLPDDARLVAYRRVEQPDDNIYNTAASAAPEQLRLIRLEPLLPTAPGLYYLWLPGAETE